MDYAGRSPGRRRRIPWHLSRPRKAHSIRHIRSTSQRVPIARKTFPNRLNPALRLHLSMPGRRLHAVATRNLLGDDCTDVQQLMDRTAHLIEATPSTRSPTSPRPPFMRRWASCAEGNAPEVARATRSRRPTPRDRGSAWGSLVGLASSKRGPACPSWTRRGTVLYRSPVRSPPVRVRVRSLTGRSRLGI